MGEAFLSESEEQHFLSKGNATLLGKGQHVVVLSHGFGGSRDSWAQFIPHLLPRYRVLIYDLYGHGKVFKEECDEMVEQFDSAVVLDAKHNWLLRRFVEDLLEILDELQIESCTFIGHSVSGMIGCLASLACPKIFTRMFLIGASPRYLNDGAYFGGFEREEVQQLLNTIEKDCDAWVQAFVPFALGPNASESHIKHYTSSFRRLKPKFTLAAAHAIFCSDFRSILSRVQVPCHVLQTANDVAVPYQAAKYLYEQLGSTEKTMELLDTEGHLPHLTSPEILLIPALLEHV